jgi:hypothetical protein
MTPTIKNSGFGSNLVVVELYFEIHVSGNLHDSAPFALYMKHGAPSRADWFRAYAPIGRYATREDAEEALDKFAGLVDAHKSFPCR